LRCTDCTGYVKRMAAAAAAAFIARSNAEDEDPVDEEDGSPLMTHVVVSRIVREGGGYRSPQVRQVLRRNESSLFCKGLGFRV